MSSGDTPAELVLYPGGSHKFLESGTPSQRLDAVSRIVGWLERWIDRPVGEALRAASTDACEAAPAAAEPG